MMALTLTLTDMRQLSSHKYSLDKFMLIVYIQNVHSVVVKIWHMIKKICSTVVSAILPTKALHPQTVWDQQLIPKSDKIL